MVLLILAYMLTGALAGLLAGLLGVGGGLVTVPAMHLIFFWQGFPSDQNMIMAIGTSLGSMVFTSAASAFSHYKKKGIDWKIFKLLLPGVMIGSLFGALIANLLSGPILQFVFGVAICLVGIDFLFPKKQNPSAAGRELRPLLHLFAGIVIGTTSTILGIGGGILSVPYLTFLRSPIKNAIATASALGFPIAFIGAVSFLWLGLQHNTVPGALGYLYLPAFAIIAIVSSIFAPLGARLVYTLPVHLLSRIFGLVLFFIGISMLY